MRKLAIVSLLLVIALVSVSAYLRLDNSGIGCADWPECYGKIGAADVAEPTIGSTYERLAVDAQQPLSWATPVHRLVASILGLTILAMALVSLRLKRDRLVSFMLLALTVFLAWLGIYSGGLHSPAIVMANLGGGFSMLGLLGWMTFRSAKPHANAPSFVRSWVVAALLLLCLQIALGGLTSANFAASACQTLPDCHGSYLPGSELATAFDLTRSHEIGPTGLAMGGGERADIHKLHRIGALITAAVVLFAGIFALRARLGLTALVVSILVITEFLLGIAAIVTELPITIATAHNGLAAMLLLALLRLLALCNNRQALL
jgi:cytochrome c oxidase assembly protein subunit 15